MTLPKSQIYNNHSLSWVQAKHCKVCTKLKPWADFRKSKNTSFMTFVPVCKECDKTRLQRRRLANHKWKLRNPDKVRAKYLRKDYGITVAEYDGMLQAQNGLCAICYQPETIEFKAKAKRLAIDHDHKTGKIRGLLCEQCNHGLGRFRDNPIYLTRAINYLNKQLVVLAA